MEIVPKAIKSIRIEKNMIKKKNSLKQKYNHGDLTKKINKYYYIQLFQFIL